MDRRSRAQELEGQRSARNRHRTRAGGRAGRAPDLTHKELRHNFKTPSPRKAKSPRKGPQPKNEEERAKTLSVRTRVAEGKRRQANSGGHDAAAKEDASGGGDMCGTIRGTEAGRGDFPHGAEPHPPGAPPELQNTPPPRRGSPKQGPEATDTDTTEGRRPKSPGFHGHGPPKPGTETRSRGGVSREFQNRRAGARESGMASRCITLPGCAC